MTVLGHVVQMNGQTGAIDAETAALQQQYFMEMDELRRFVRFPAHLWLCSPPPFSLHPYHPSHPPLIRLKPSWTGPHVESVTTCAHKRTS